MTNSPHLPRGTVLKAATIVLTQAPATSITDIAQVLGVSRQAVYDQLKKHRPDLIQDRTR